MALATRPLHPLFGAEILDVDVKRVDEPTFRATNDAAGQMKLCRRSASARQNERS